MDQTLFPGGYFKEFIFFHKASKTLILTDTIINIELNKMPEPWRTATKLTGMYHPRGQIFFGMRLPLLLQRRKAKAALAKVHSWQPERVLLSHGRCFESHGDEVIKRIFGEPPIESKAGNSAGPLSAFHPTKSSAGTWGTASFHPLRSYSATSPNGRNRPDAVVRWRSDERLESTLTGHSFGDARSPIG
jgi:hypothetical protein